MTYFVTYNNLTRNLVDVSTSLPSAQPNELTILSFADELPDLYFNEWDTETLSFKPKANVERTVSVHQFLNLLTAQERIAIKEIAKTNMAIQDYMDMLNSATCIDLSSMELYGGLCFLASLGLLTQARVSEIINANHL